MKIAVIGASGFLGEKLMEHFSENNEVIGTYHEKKKEGLVFLDATKKDEVQKFLFKHNPDIVIDTIALTSSVACEKNPELCEKLNYETAKNISEVCSDIGSKMVFISSSYIFNGKKGNYTEKDPVSPTNEYALKKIMAENFISKMNNYLIIRVDVMYGFDGKSIKFGTGNFLKESIDVGHPNLIRTPVFIDDVPNVIDELIHKKQSGIFHVAGPEKIIMIDFLKRLAAIENSEEKIKIVDSSGWIVKSPANSSLDISKLNSLGIKTTSFEESLNILKKFFDS